jgi:tetratricopeptide (TPR) repeat protein
MTRTTTTEAVAATAEWCADAMAARWRAGERPAAEEYLDAHPELWDHPDAALELIAEELALRAEHGPPASGSELTRRFPRWPAQVAALLDCQRALGPRPGPPVFPNVGDWLGDFFLRAELGRGAHARVYLASQPDLADRPVVLKVGPDDGAEHLSLARLQHTHIVPLYSVHEFPDRGLRALCMPYFGGKTLADVSGNPSRESSGSAWLTADSTTVPNGTRGPAWRFLERADLPDAVCWVGACLADALQYAHERGLVHLDLKPSNVLIAADGTPMLLDFHLARPPLATGDPAPGWLGGTPGFMAPEQEKAVAAIRAGRPAPIAVDGRADVYALGLLLSGLFRDAGYTPSAAVADVLARCTAADSADRYATAGAVATDLRRHLADLPLKGVRNRSVSERWRKWRRRRPLDAPLALAFAALAAVGGGLFLHAERLADRAEAALRAGQEHLAAGRFAEAAEAFHGGEALVPVLPFHDDLRRRLRIEAAAASRGLKAADLAAVADRARLYLGADGQWDGRAEVVARECRTRWDDRAVLATEFASAPKDAWSENLLDVGLFVAESIVRSATPTGRDSARGQALAVLDEAEWQFGPSAAVELERARYARAAGKNDLAVAAEKRAANLPARRPWERVLVGRSYLAAGEYAKAAAVLTEAAAETPQSLWAQHYLGTSLLKLHRPVEAAAAFSACTALAPGAGWCFHNRGLAYLAAERPEAARADFEKCLDLDPGFAAGYLGLAAVRTVEGRYAEAQIALTRAAETGAAPAEVNYRRAVVYLKAKDREAAKAALEKCLESAPEHADAKQLLDQAKAWK